MLRIEDIARIAHQAAEIAYRLHPWDHSDKARLIAQVAYLVANPDAPHDEVHDKTLPPGPTQPLADQTPNAQNAVHAFVEVARQLLPLLVK